MIHRKIYNREDFKNLIIEIENTFQVNEWKVNEIHLWPIIRIKLFFYLINEVENPKIQKNENPIRKQVKFGFLRSLKERLIFNKWLLLFPKKKIVYVGTDAHRVNYEGKRFNRFFDSLNSLKNQKNDYLYLEYLYDRKLNYHKNELVFETENRIENFCRSRNYTLKYSFTDFDNFLNLLKQNPVTETFAKEMSIENFKQMGYKIYYRKKFYEKILKRIKPQELYMLCFYGSSTTYALIAAANYLKIKTIEMQHGPQPDLHLCYTNWTNLPENGYNVMPRNYFQWDENSVQYINSWTKNTKLYHPKKIGHPWIDFINEINVEISHERFILYCLQPHPVQLSFLFNKNILQAIKNSKFTWYIRLHPRQLDKKNEILQILLENDLQNIVNIEDATNLPLPSLIKKSLVCVTHSSGSVIEAEMLNKKSILIHKMGVKYFPKTVERGNAIFINADENSFSDNFESFINQL